MMYDAQALVAPEEHIGKGAHLLNLLAPHIDTFVGIAPRAKRKPTRPLIQSGGSPYTLWQQTSLPRVLFSQRPDIFVSPFNTAPLYFPKQTKLLLVVHDLIPFERYQGVGLRLQSLLAYWRYLIAASIRRASLVITVSEYSRNEILRHFPEANVIVLTNSISESWYVRDNARPDRERGNYLLMVSSLNPHKNIDRGLQAYSEYLRSTGPSSAHLQIVGIHPSAAVTLQPRLRELGVSEYVSFAPYLTMPKLQELYRSARAFFMPSLLEGFGIPVLEAMASGTPVISSSTASLPEVGGNAPEYFDPHSVSSISEALTKVLSSDTLRESMAKGGLSQAERFHPDIVQGQIRKFWAELPDLSLMPTHQR